MRVAVTGASGYLGSSFVETLTAHGIDTLSLARRGPPGGFVSWRLGDRPQLVNVDVLVHCAFDFQNYAVNVPGTRRLYQSAREDGVGCVIHVSSLAAFETCRSAFGRTKLALERLTIENDGVSIRPATVWSDKAGGPVGFIQAFLRKALIVPSLTGCAPLRLIHLDDLIELMLRVVVNRDRLRGRVLGAASSDLLEFDELLHLLLARMGLRRMLMPVPAALVQLALVLAEKAGIWNGLRADAVRSLRNGNPNPDIALPGFLAPTNMRSIRAPT